MLPIADLHCDLLSFLAEDPKRTIDDPLSKASYPEMTAGGVAFQALAIFTHSTKNSLVSGNKQLQCFRDLLENHADCYTLFEPGYSLEQQSEKSSAKNLAKQISIMPAFENAYGFSEEGEPIEKGLKHLDSVLKEIKRILYISLTWDGENRFGGGCGSKIGLKEDGKRVLEWMDSKKIAIDLSHTSDFLADEIFNYLDKKSLKVPVMASHSNMRAITPKERNLPDFLTKEILARDGLIGLNLFAPFIGKEPEAIAEHVEHLFTLGGEKNLCFGADFFPDLGFEYLKKKYQTDVGFFQELGNSSCYPRALAILQNRLNLTDNQLQAIAYRNFEKYIYKM